jgi:hypothetical protein
MDHEAFMRKVAEMRELQKLYFRNKQYDTLVRAKEAEKAVDAVIKSWQLGQEMLFGGKPSPMCPGCNVPLHRFDADEDYCPKCYRRYEGV